MEFLRVFTDYYSTKKDYCVICLRSSEERRMVTIKSVENFLKSVNLPCSYLDEKVCFVCERQALAAHRFRLAVNLSASVHNLFHMMKAPRTRHNVFKQIHGEKPCEGVIRNVPEWEQRLAAVRHSTQLLQTEVLCVNSLTSQSCEAEDSVETVTYPRSLPGSSADLYVIPDDSPPPPPPADDVTSDVVDIADTRDRVHDVLSEPEIYMESVVILDEEDDPINIKTETPNDITINNNINIDKILNTPNNLAPNRNPNFLLHPIVEKDGMVTVPSLAAQIINGQLVTMDKSNIIIQTPKLALQNGKNFDLLTDPSQVHNVLKGISGKLKSYSVVSDVIPLSVLENNVMQSVDFGANFGQIATNLTQNPLSNIIPIITNGAHPNITNVQNNQSLTQMQNIANVQNNLIYGQQITNVESVRNGKNEKSYINLNKQMQMNETQNAATNKSILRPLLTTNNGKSNAGLTSPGNSSGFNPTQVYNKGIQHINIPSTEKLTFVIEQEDTNEPNAVSTETAPVGGKRKLSETDNSKRSKIEGDGKQSEKTQKETDWEDKIPMDVISFMDATDPNAEEVLKSKPPKTLEPTPMGLITNVHTVTDDESLHKNQDITFGESLQNTEGTLNDSGKTKLQGGLAGTKQNTKTTGENQKLAESTTTAQNVKEAETSEGYVKIAPKTRGKSTQSARGVKRNNTKRTKQVNSDSEVIDLC